MQTRLTSGPLHNAQGELDAVGWATREVRRYSRAAIGASRWRIKEWDYYCIGNDDCALALTVADNGYLGFLGLAWMDFAARTATNHGAVRTLPLGRMALPESADRGDIVQRHGGVDLAFRHVPGGRILTFAAPKFGVGKGLSGEIRLTQPDDDRMVIATPFAENRKAFYYNQKINCMPAAGEVVLGGERIGFDPASSFAVLDWGRGVWTFDNTWYWGSASGLVDGRRFGFNIGYGFGDTSAASENMLFLDGTAHKLDRVEFHMPAGSPDSAPWRFSSNDGRFELDFTPLVDRADKVSLLGLFVTDQHQVFGRFSGTVVLDDGTRLEIRDLTGFAEKVHNRW